MVCFISQDAHVPLPLHAGSHPTHEALLTALGDARFDILPFDVIGVVGLDIGRKTVQSALDSLLGGGVHHTRILRRIIRAPADKGDLVARTLTRLQLILDVEDGISTTDSLLAASVLALCVQELVTESVVVGVCGGLLNDNLFPVIADLVDDPFDILAELELVERADALGGYGDTGLSHDLCVWRD